MEPELKKELSNQNKTLDKIERGLYGDNENKSKGLLERVKDLEDALVYVLFVIKRPVFAFGLFIVFMDIVIWITNKGLNGLFQFLAK